MRRAAILAALLLVTASTAGCTSIYVAHVPSGLLVDGWHENPERRDEDKRFLGIGLNRVTLVYQSDENRFNGPYPAEFLVTSLRILGGASRSELLQELDASLQGVLEKEGVTLDQASRHEGQRTLARGQESLYFTYSATAKAGSSFFDSGRRLRIVGEVFSDEASDLTVLLIGLAQITGGSVLTGQENTSQWARIVGDPNGTIEGFKRSDGLAYNVVSHG